MEVKGCCADRCPYRDTCCRWYRGRNSKNEDNYDFSLEECNKENGFSEYMPITRM